MISSTKQVFAFQGLENWNIADLPTTITCKSGGFEKQAQKNLEIRTSNLEASKMCVK